MNKEENEELQERINKAIEYIESYNIDFKNTKFGECPLTICDLEVLIKILRGDNNE